MPNFKKNTSPAMKRSAYKMKGYTYPGTSPVTDKGEHSHPHETELTDKQRQENLLEVVPNEEAFNALPPEDQKGFTEAWIKSKGVTKQVKAKKKKQ